MFEAFVLKVFIATPGDTGEEVEAVIESLHRWNGSRAERDQVILLPRHWRLDAVSRVGRGSVQDVINKQLLDNADIVLAVFDSRLGQATADGVAATAGEIQRAINAEKHVHVWFSREPLERNVDPKQITALRKFEKELEKQGLLGEYGSLEDLRNHVRNAVENDLAEMGLGSPTVHRREVEHAKPRARRDNGYLVIENKSETVTAEQFHFTFEFVWPAGFDRVEDPVHLHYDDPPFNLLAGADMRWGMDVDMLDPPNMTVHMHWMEGTEPREASETIPL